MEIKELFAKLKPIVGEKLNSLWADYVCSDTNEKNLIRQNLELLYATHLNDYSEKTILLPPPSTLKELYGEYPLGNVWYGGKSLYPFGLLEQELTQHIGIFGRTGAGKSYLVHHLIRRNHWLRKPSLIFDWKGTYDNLIDLNVIIPGQTKFVFNPLDTSRISPDYRRGFIRRIVELFLDAYLDNPQLLTAQGVEFLLLKGLEQASTFQELYVWVSVYKGKAVNGWKTTVLNLLYKLNSGPLGVMMNGDADNIETLLKTNVRFELQHLGSAKDKQFFITSFLLHLMNHFQQLGATNRLRLLIVIEEAHHILKKTKGESVVEVMLRQIREYGVGVIIVDQHPSLMSIPALGTFCTVAFNLSSREDRETMASALNLNSTEDLGKLGHRFAIVKIQDRYLQPFLIKTFDFHVGGRSEMNVEAVSRGSLPKNSINAVSRPSLSQNRTGYSDEIKMLKNVFECPVMNTTERYRQLGMSDYKGNQLKLILVKKGLLYVEDVRLEKGRMKLLTLTQTGCACLGVKHSGKKGGVWHQFWVRRLAGRFSLLGHHVVTEKNLSRNCAVDIAVTLKNKIIGVEIETGSNHKSQIEANVEKCSQYLDGVVVLWLSDSKTDFDVVYSEQECIKQVMEFERA